MKPFVVKPFIVKPILIDPNARHWWWFISTGVLYFLAVEAIILAVIVLILGDRDLAILALTLGNVLGFVGHGLVAIGRFIRDSQKNHSELTKRVSEQDERIRNLEEQLAALTTPTPTY